MTASGSWTRAWAGWVSRVVLGLALAVVLAGCDADADIGRGEAPSAGPAPAAASTSGKARMPAALRASYLAARQRDGGEAYRFERAPGRGAAGRNAAHRLDVALVEGVLGLSRRGGDAWHLGLGWTGLGRGSTIATVARPETEADVAGNRATYRRADGSEEQYVNGPLGVEQGFVLPAAPAGAGGEALTVEVTLEGDLAPVLMEGGAGVALRDARGATVARYTDLAAFDAGGAERRSWIEVSGGVVRLRVDDDGAPYPLRIDPLVSTQQAELTASDGAAGDDFGASVSVSGGTAIVGDLAHPVGGNASAGAAYVFVESGTTWTQQAELTASDGATEDDFGISVSVSGGTAIVGATGHKVGSHAAAGAAYVFVESGATWTQQAELTASDGAADDLFGSSVSMSGGTAIAGAPYHGAQRGAAYVFVQQGTAWTQQAELTASDGETQDHAGDSVSVSGGTAIVGAPFHTVGTQLTAGAAYVFVQQGTAWTQEAELTASDAAQGDQLGGSVSVSGGTAVVGALGRQVGGHIFAGDAYLFVQSGTAWAQEAELTASDGAASDFFGWSVSVSGGAAFVGAVGHVDGNIKAGAVYVFELCVVGGTAYASGTTNPANACQVCDPSTSTTAWSDQSDGTACPGGTCEAGVCNAVADGGSDAGSGGAGGSSTTTSSSSGSTTGTTASSSSGSTTATSGGGGSTTGTSGGGGGSTTGTSGSGCACTTAPSSSPPLGLAALGALLGLAATRRGSRARRST
jgi:MYXO-CTERM domain-containing protein